ncbi:hypothetical protein H4R34_002736 [Dimargaris verticillata]|uniref:Oligomerization domain-containing protein n=1 Tax=Dimargaris verticillata TaxID=2761393 RepID=A0A9W8B8X0_9FUNG|nr:hypothetical protein H4R34_002736 [Dimargaris verticillata]
MLDRYYSCTPVRHASKTPGPSAFSEESTLATAPSPISLPNGAVDDHTPVSSETSGESAAPADDWFVDPVYEDSQGQARKSFEPATPRSGQFIPLWQRKSYGQQLNAEQRQKAVEAGLPWVHCHPLAYQWPALDQVTDWVKACTDMLRYLKAQNVVVMDMRAKCDWTEFMVIAEADSQRQIYSAAMAILKTIKSLQRVRKTLGTQPHTEGLDESDWAVLNLGKITIHIMTKEAREAYNLEGLWSAIHNPLLRPPSDATTSAAELDITQIRAMMHRDFQASAHFTETEHESMTEEAVLHGVNWRP